MEISDYWKTVRRRWRTIAVAVGVCVALAGVVTWRTTPMYSSSSQLFVATKDTDAAQAYQGGLFAAERVQSYADIVPKSQQLAKAVVADLGGTVTTQQVMSEISASVVPDTVNLVITATDTSPKRARDISQAYATALTNLVSDLETPQGSDAALIRAEIVQDATLSTTPVSPVPFRNLGLGLLLGLLLGVVLAIARELLDNTVTRSEALSEIVGAPTLGRITSDGSAVKQQPGLALAGNTAWAESFRVLRTNMQYVDVDTDHKVFVVTSSLPQEGKSTTAVNLAVTLALTNLRVALIECDLRRPLIARRLGLDGAVGTTSVLIGKVALRDAIQTHGDSGLDVLACGPIPPNPAELLQSRAMKSMLTDLRNDYDIVLLDAPPLLPVTDAAILAAQTDGALLIARYGKTTTDQLSQATERLSAVDAKSVGAVFNMVPARHAAGGYSYGYGYGYAPLEEPTGAPVRPTHADDAHSEAPRSEAKAVS